MPPDQEAAPPHVYTHDTTARFDEPRSISIGDDDSLYVFDGSLRIRKIPPTGDVVTLPVELPADGRRAYGGL